MTDDQALVARVHVDFWSVLQELIGADHTLVKDIGPHERICPTCKGLGIAKRASSYGLGEPGKPHFPYLHEFIGFCPDCYGGQQTLCEFCGEPAGHGRTSLGHGCKAAMDASHARSRAKELERRKLCERMPLSEYDEEMLYDDGDELFVSVTDDLDPEHTYFACHKSTDWLVPDADRVVEWLYDQASDECTEECDVEDVVIVSDDAKSKLDEILKAWFAEHVKLEVLYFPNHKVIVEVPWPGDEDEEE